MGPLPDLHPGNWIEGPSGPSRDLVTAPRGWCSGAETRLGGHRTDATIARETADDARVIFSALGSNNPEDFCSVAWQRGALWPKGCVFGA